MVSSIRPEGAYPRSIRGQTARYLPWSVVRCEADKDISSMVKSRKLRIKALNFTVIIHVVI